jgi:UDP-glucose 4-epimerase
MGRVAITGIASFLGGRLLQRLVAERGADAVLAVDVAAPPAALSGVGFRELDLTEPAADQRLLDALQEERVNAVVHMAFHTTPRRDASASHELESIGTLAVLAAAAAAGVERFVMRSSTAVYGARGENPSFLTEERPLQANPRLHWVRDKLEAEHHAASFARRYPGMAVSVLRFATLLGPGVRNFYTRIFDKRVVPVLMGYDPLLQLLHPDDALEAALRVVQGPVAKGIFNVVPKSAIPLVSAVHLADKIPVSVPHPLAALASDLLWSAGLVEAPGAFVDYARYPFVADGAKAERELGWKARYGSREALATYLRDRHQRPVASASEAPA